MGNKAKLVDIYPIIEPIGSLSGTRRILVQFYGYMFYSPPAQTGQCVRQWPVSDATDAIISYFNNSLPTQLTLAGGEPLQYADWIQRLLRSLPDCEVQLRTSGTPVKELALLLPQLSCISLHWELDRMDFETSTVQLDRKRSLQLINLRQGELILHLSVDLLADKERLMQKLIAVQTLVHLTKTDDELPIYLAIPAATTDDCHEAAASCFAIFPKARVSAVPIVNQVLNKG